MQCVVVDVVVERVVVRSDRRNFSDISVDVHKNRTERRATCARWSYGCLYSDKWEEVLQARR
jgi:hypothetical protein